jgi:hypothetical protein
MGLYVIATKTVVIVSFLLLAVLVVSFVPAFKVSRGETARDRVWWAFWLCSGLNAVAVFTWVATVIEILPLRTRIPITDYGAPLGGLALLFLVPPGLLWIWWCVRRAGAAVPIPVKRYVSVSTAYLLVSLLPGIQLVIFYSLMMGSNR